MVTYDLLLEFIEEQYKRVKRYPSTQKNIFDAMNMAFGALCLYCEGYYRNYGYDCVEAMNIWNDEWRNKFYELEPTVKEV